LIKNINEKLNIGRDMSEFDNYPEIKKLISLGRRLRKLLMMRLIIAYLMIFSLLN